MIETIKYQLKTKSLLLKCIAASLLLHFMLLYFFYKHPLALYASTLFHKSRPNPTSIAANGEIPSEQQDTALEEVFENLVILPAALSEPYDIVSMPAPVAIAPNLEEAGALTPLTPQLEASSLSSEDLFTNIAEAPFNESEEILSSVILPAEQETPLILSENLTDVLANSFHASQKAFPEIAYIEPLQESSLAALEDKALPENMNPYLEDVASGEEIPSVAEGLSTLKTPSELIRIPSQVGEWGQRDIAPKPAAPGEVSMTARDFIVPYAQPGLASIEDDQVLELASVAAWNEDFDVSVSISPPTSEEDYIFSVALTPKSNLSMEKLSQNFYFLIDASSSIDKHRFSLFKRATLKSLATLQEGDRFNIILLDKKQTRLSKANLIYNLKSLHLAEEFLEKHSQANFITSVDLMESLEKIAEQITEGGQMHTALLLTNGQSALGFQNQQKALKAYIEKNANKLSLYAAAVGNKNNLVNLDMICSLSGGKLLYSDTNASFPRKFSQLVKSLRTPIAKDLRITAVASHPKAALSLHSASSHLPAMYVGESYIIMGKIDRLSDINLSIEARHDDEWVSIQKNISFNKAAVDNKLLKEWSKAEVHTHYENFLKDPKAKHIKKAREILTTSMGKAASE